jgi:hypothetical protein
MIWTSASKLSRSRISGMHQISAVSILQLDNRHN